MPEAARRVALVISHMNMGGAQRQLVNLMRALDPARWRPVLVCFGPSTELTETLRAEGFDVRFVPKRGRIDPTLIPRLARTLRSIRPDVVHTTLRTANLWGRAAAIAAGIPHRVASERSAAYKTGWPVRAASRWLGRRTDAITVNSQAGVPWAARHHDHLETRVTVIPNGVALPPLDAGSVAAARRALRALAGWQEASRVAAIVGNLLPEKELGDALTLAGRMRGPHPDLRWVAFGEGPERERVASGIRSAGLEAVVHLAGHRRDLSALLPGADLLVQTSSREGMPNAVLEGMAAGLPVVATDAGGTAEAMGHDGGAGTLAAVHDLDALSSGIARALDPEAKRRMGAEGRRRAAERFSIDAMARATERLWEERCLDGGSAPRTVVVLSRYSRRSTFIVRELRALRAAGADLAIVSLLPPEDNDGTIGPSTCAGDGVLYLPFLPGPVWAASACGALLRHPIRSASALATVLFGQLRTPRVMLRSAAVFPKMLMIAGTARRIRARSIHAHWATVSATAGMCAARIAGLPFSFSGHAWDLYFDNALLPRKLEAARFVAVCNAHSGAMLRERWPSRAGGVRLLYHGLDLRRFVFQPPVRGAPGGPLRILAIGRLVRKKGFDALIRACGRLLREGVDLECVILGEGGPEESALHALIAQEAPGKVRIEGYLPEDALRERMRRFDLLAAPSIVQTDGAMDGIPNVVIEAMAVGLPVVTTAVAGLPEIAHDGMTALVVAQNDPQALAGALRRLSEDPALAASLAASARAVIEARFDDRKIAETLKGFLSGEN